MTFNIVSSIQSQVTGGVNPTDFSFADITASVAGGITDNSNDFQLGQGNVSSTSIYANNICMLSSDGKYAIIGGTNLSVTGGVSSTKISVMTSQNYGISWNSTQLFYYNGTTTFDTSYAAIAGVAVADNGYMYLTVSTDAYLRKSTDGGLTWSIGVQVADFVGGDIACSPSGQYVTSCYGYQHNTSITSPLRISSDYCNTVVTLNNTVGLWSNVYISFDGQTLLATKKGTFSKSTNVLLNGSPNASATFADTTINSGVTNYYTTSLAVSKNLKIIVVGTSNTSKLGTIYISRDGGTTFTEKVISSSTSAMGMASISYSGKIIFVSFAQYNSSTNLGILSYPAKLAYSKDYGSTFTVIENSSLPTDPNDPNTTSGRQIGWRCSFLSGDGSRALAAVTSNASSGNTYPFNYLQTSKFVYMSDNK